MKPYYQDDYVTIYHGDCREILPELPDSSVDLVLTDPPWNDDDLDSFDLLGRESFRLLKESRFLISYTGLRRLFEVASLFDTNGLKYFWLSSGVHLNSHEIFAGYKIFRKWKPILLYYKGALPKRNYFSDAFKLEMDKHYHEWGQAESSALRWLCMAVENDLILDPFLGSGTTAYCAKKLNRKCIGIEIVEKYCEISANRCRQMVFDFNK